MTTTLPDHSPNPSILSTFNAAGPAVWDMVEASLRVRDALPLRDPSRSVASLAVKTRVRRDLLNEILSSVKQAGTPNFRKVAVEEHIIEDYDDPADFDFFTDWPLARLADLASNAHAAIRTSNATMLDAVADALSVSFGINGKAIILRPAHGSGAMSPALIDALTVELREQKGMVGPWVLHMRPLDMKGNKRLGVSMCGFDDGLETDYTVNTCWIQETATWILESELSAYCVAAADRLEAEANALTSEATSRAMFFRHKAQMLRWRA